MQIISDHQTVRSNTVQDSKEFNFQSLATQVKNRRTKRFYDACF